MVSSASAQIEASKWLYAPLDDAYTHIFPLAGGNHLKTTIPGNPDPVPDYAKVQGILIGVVAAFVLVVTIIGPECVYAICPVNPCNADHDVCPETTARTSRRRRPLSRRAADRTRWWRTRTCRRATRCRGRAASAWTTRKGHQVRRREEGAPASEFVLMILDTTA